MIPPSKTETIKTIADLKAYFVEVDELNRYNGVTAVRTTKEVATELLLDNVSIIRDAKIRYFQIKHIGRWPANIILDEYTAKLLDEQSGISKSQGGTNPIKKSMFNLGSETLQPSGGFGDVGGASRFFYVAKANKKDRNEGLEALPIKRPDDRTSTGMGTFEEKGVQPQHNFHPTVKPTALMRYLVRLVTPENGVVLDPFAGSGSTGKAAILEGYKFIGIELTAEYLPIIAGRLQHAYDTYNNKTDDLFE